MRTPASSQSDPVLAEPALERVRIDLATRIDRVLRERPALLDQTAALLQMPTVKLPAVIAGRLSTSSLDQLFRILVSLGEDVEVVIRRERRRKRRGDVRVVEAGAIGGGATSIPAASGRTQRQIRSPDDRTRPGHAQLLDKHAVEQMTSLDITTIYRKIAAGTFPPPVRVGRRRVAWRTTDILQWEDALDVGTEAAEWMKAARTRAAATAGPTPAVFSDSVGALYEQFQKQARHLRSWPEQRRIFEKEVLPAWEHRRVTDIARSDIRELINVKAEKAPVMANRLLSRISRLFSFAVEQDWIDKNPALGMAKPARERTRDRVLSREELRELWAALGRRSTAPRLSRALCDVLLMMLMTAQRCGEVSRMQWVDVDLGTGWWVIPTQDSKNSDPHRVPLTDSAVALLQNRRRAGKRTDRYVFTNDGHTCVADRAKKDAAELCRDLSFHFRAHDLRRTAASFMGEAGVDRFHIALVLNHRSVTHSTVTAIYDRYQYDKEKRAALETWARLLREIVVRRASRRKRRSRT